MALQLLVPLHRLLVGLCVEIDETVEVDGVATERLDAQVQDLAVGRARRDLDVTFLQEEAQHVVHFTVLDVLQDAVHVVDHGVHGIVLRALCEAERGKLRSCSLRGSNFENAAAMTP